MGVWSLTMFHKNLATQTTVKLSLNRRLSGIGITGFIGITIAAVAVMDTSGITIAAVAVMNVMVIGGTNMLGDTSDHGLGQMPRMAACQSNE